MKYVTKTIAEIFPNLGKDPRSAYVNGKPLQARKGEENFEILSVRVVGRGRNKGKVCLTVYRRPKGKDYLFLSAQHLFFDPTTPLEVKE